MASLDDLLDSVDIGGDPDEPPLPPSSAAEASPASSASPASPPASHHPATPLFHTLLLSCLSKMGRLSPPPLNGCLTKSADGAFGSPLLAALGERYGEGLLREAFRGRLEGEVDEDAMGPLSRRLKNE